MESRRGESLDPAFALVESFFLCSHCRMERIEFDVDPSELSSILLSVPMHTVAGLLSADCAFRTGAADTVALAVVQMLHPHLLPDPAQLALPL